MNWVTFEVVGGGRVAVQLQHIVAIYDELGAVKLATTASGVHVLKETTVQRAVTIISAAAEAVAISAAAEEEAEAVADSVAAKTG